MFGLFQADLPIGRRLWLIILTLVSFGSLQLINVSTVAVDPAKFVVDVLVFFGYVSLLSSILLIIPDFIKKTIYQAIDRKLEKTNPYETAVKWRRNRWWFHSLQDILFIAATLYAAKDFGSATMYEWGFIGLIGVLVDEVVDWDDVYVKTKQVLELHISQGGKIKAKLVRSDDVEEFTVPSANWLLEIQSLKHSGWEVLESNLLGTRKSIILERDANLNFINLLIDFLDQKLRRIIR
jgi:hypothetical protein